MWYAGALHRVEEMPTPCNIRTGSADVILDYFVYAIRLEWAGFGPRLVCGYVLAGRRIGGSVYGDSSGSHLQIVR